MPSLVRFLTLLALAAGLFYSAIYILATAFEPAPREMTKSLRNIKVK